MYYTYKPRNVSKVSQYETQIVRSTYIMPKQLLSNDLKCFTAMPDSLYMSISIPSANPISLLKQWN